MSSRVTEVDLHIAKRLREFRTSNSDANMRKLASFLGIKYQSYQAMEKGEVSLRVSTIQKVAMFYGVTFDEFLGEDCPSPMPNIGRTQYLMDILKDMSKDAAQEVLSFALQMKRETVNGDRR